MKIYGKTDDQNPVVGNVFRFTGTNGIPLEIVLGYLKDKGFIIDWVDWIQCALKDGWKPSTIKARILSAIGEIYGPKYKIEFEKRLNAVL